MVFLENTLKLIFYKKGAKISVARFLADFVQAGKKFARNLATTKF